MPRRRHGTGPAVRTQFGAHNKHTPQILNPPFDPRMRRIGSRIVNPKPLKRGWIRTGPEESENLRINFLFNPSEINVTHSIDSNIPSNEQVNQNPNRVPGSTAMYVETGMGLSFSLLFDRTYEMYTRDKSQQNFARAYGVYSDVAAFYRYLNIIPDLPFNSPAHIRLPGSDPETGGALDMTGWTAISPHRPAQLRSSYVYIGTRMFYYGYINSFDVTYTHWSHDMVPIRCRVDIGFTLQVDPALVDEVYPAAAVPGDDPTQDKASNQAGSNGVYDAFGNRIDMFP